MALKMINSTERYRSVIWCVVVSFCKRKEVFWIGLDGLKKSITEFSVTFQSVGPKISTLLQT